jgi:ring-1,2-phenylacetyl-CoA epoxidase subunit PaaE
MNVRTNVRMSYLCSMSRYHPLRVVRIRPETSECVSVWLEVPDHLKNEFSFKPGQYLNCRAFVNGEEVRKSYSICTIPDEALIAVAVKKVHGGRMSTYINQELSEGDVLEVMPPEGKFVLPENLSDSPVLLFFAAGSGITPIISLIRHYVLNYPNGQAILFYSNKASDTIIFREDLQSLKNQFVTRFSIYHILTREITSTELFSGRIDKYKCGEFGRFFFDPSQVEAAFICGPELMIHDVRDALADMGIPMERIRFELFGSAQSNVRSRDQITPQSDEGDTRVSKVTVRIDGHEADFQIPYNGEPVLDVALKSGLDIPYSCKGGVCSTCRALVVEGDVNMDIHYGLEPDEIDAGYVLTCQAHPRSERVILDYDIL